MGGSRRKFRRGSKDSPGKSHPTGVEARLDPLDPVTKPCSKGGRSRGVCHSCVF